MAWLFLVYLLLAMSVSVRLDAEIDGIKGRYWVEVRALGIRLIRDGRIDLLKRALYTHGGRTIRLRTKGNKRADLLKILKAGKMESAFLYARLGLEDAAVTAVAAGALRAALLSVFAGFRAVPVLCVEPAFDRFCFRVNAQGIYSFRPGDIILAAVKAAWIRKKREGFTWKSIPLKA